MKKIILPVLSFIFPAFLFSQILTLENAIATTLENNYGIRATQNAVETARNNTDRGINGYKPVLNLTASPSASLGSSAQKFNGPLNDAEVTNAFSWAAGASLSAQYNLFDKTRDLTLKQLKEKLSLADLQLRQTIETTLLQLFDAYYEVARLSENLEVLRQALSVSHRRLQQTQYRLKYGQGLRLDVLNARVDIQRDSINLLQAQRQTANAKRNLNLIMGVPVTTDFQIDTTVHFNSNLSPEQLLVKAKKENTALLIIEKNRKISEVALKIIDASRMPSVGSNLTYNFNYQNNAPGSFIATNRNNGLNAGLSLNWNLLDGGRRKIQLQNTRLAINTHLIQKEQLEHQLETQVLNGWENYQNALSVLEVEKNALSTNRLNMERTRELFETGQVTSVEFRQAQLNYLNAQKNHNLAKYSAKLAELRLLQLSGELLQEL